jgi:hypothetical protein
MLTAGWHVFKYQFGNGRRRARECRLLGRVTPAHAVRSGGWEPAREPWFMPVPGAPVA